MANEGLRISAEGLNALAPEEGEIAGIYDDYKGYGTFGIGHLLHGKQPSLLLRAARQSPTFSTALVRRPKAGLYLPCAAAFSHSFPALRAEAVDKGLLEVGALATSWVQAEAALLARSPRAVLAQDLIPREQAVRRGAHVQLVQSEFDALISFQFNTGSLLSGLIKSINAATYRSFRGLALNPMPFI